jgi:quercetin dioxygenase-like cupin family protein
MGWHVVDGSKAEWTEREALFEGQPPRQIIEVTDEAALKSSRARLWRYPPGTRGRRHADKVQEEVFVVVSGTLTMQLGDPPERVDVGAPGLIAVEPGTPLLVRNESDEDLVLYIYGAPAEQGGADFLEDTGDL